MIVVKLVIICVRLTESVWLTVLYIVDHAALDLAVRLAVEVF